MDNQLLWHNFYQEVARPDEQIGLAQASLYFAQAEDPDLNVQNYLDILEAIAIEDRGNEDNLTRAKILLKLDT